MPKHSAQECLSPKQIQWGKQAFACTFAQPEGIVNWFCVSGAAIIWGVACKQKDFVQIQAMARVRTHEKTDRRSEAEAIGVRPGERAGIERNSPKQMRLSPFSRSNLSY